MKRAQNQDISVLLSPQLRQGGRNRLIINMPYARALMSAVCSPSSPTQSPASLTSVLHQIESLRRRVHLGGGAEVRVHRQKDQSAIHQRFKGCRKKA